MCLWVISQPLHYLMSFQSTAKIIRLENCPLEFKPFYHRMYADDIFVLSNVPEHLNRFHSYLNSSHVNISFTKENEKNNRISLLDVNIINELDKFTISVCRKPSFSGIYTHLTVFLPSSYKIGMIHTLLYRSFRICSDWTTLHLELGSVH